MTNEPVTDRPDATAPPADPALAEPPAVEPPPVEPPAVERNAPLQGMSHDDLTARLLEVSTGSRNVEEPVGTAQWPTGQLTHTERKLLAAAMRRRRAA